MADSATEAPPRPAADTPAPAKPAAAKPVAKPATEAKAVHFDAVSAEGKPRPDADANLDLILDVSVTLSMEVGRTRIPIRNLLQLSQGSVVELQRTASEPLDIFVNGTLIAHGEVVVVNERFGIRLTDVVSPAERIRKLR